MGFHGFRRSPCLPAGRESSACSAVFFGEIRAGVSVGKFKNTGTKLATLYTNKELWCIITHMAKRITGIEKIRRRVLENQETARDKSGDAGEKAGKSADRPPPQKAAKQNSPLGCFVLPRHGFPTSTKTYHAESLYQNKLKKER